jgi:acyl-CoA synthetase (AMP-forming)/AMP-acid ligase II
LSATVNEIWDSYPCVDVRNYHTGIAPSARHFARQFMPYRQFQTAAAMAPAKTALVIGDVSLSYAELEAMIDKMARGLKALGVRAGEAVCVLVGNHCQQLPLWLAIAKIGGVSMAASRYLTHREIMFQLDESRPRLVIGDYGISIDAVLAAATNQPVIPFDNEDAALAICFSSGTTGQPKMMIASHLAQAWQYPVYAKEMKLDDRDVHFCVGPLAHAAVHFALAQLFVGGKVVMKEKFEKETFWRECAAHGITNTMVVPTMIISALEYPGTAPELRAMTSLGAPLPPSLKPQLLERFPHVDLYDMYGPSEFGMATCLRPHEQLTEPTSAGRPCFGLDIRSFDDEGQPVPDGEVGTIYVRGVSQVNGIIGSVRPSPIPEHLATDGWSNCGDLGRFDQDGFLYISDRRVDLILSGGLNVYPAEVEMTLCEVPGVRNAAVVGLPSERWGQEVVAYIEGNPTVTTEDVLAVCKEKLAVYKHPRAIYFVEELPRNSTGKISRKLVRDAMAAVLAPGARWVSATRRTADDQHRICREPHSIQSSGCRPCTGTFRPEPSSAASKRGGAELTRTADVETGTQNIRITAISPGYIATPIAVASRLEHPKIEAIDKLNALKRWGRPEENAALALWLASDKASYAKGGDYALDAGYLAR